jgi:DNA ligase (NAD+)
MAAMAGLNFTLDPIGKMEYFFKILGNNDGFGIATIKKLYKNGVRKISEIYVLTHSDLTKMGKGVISKLKSY